MKSRVSRSLGARTTRLWVVYARRHRRHWWTSIVTDSQLLATELFRSLLIVSSHPITSRLHRLYRFSAAASRRFISHLFSRFFPNFLSYMEGDSWRHRTDTLIASLLTYLLTCYFRTGKTSFIQHTGWPKNKPLRLIVIKLYWNPPLWLDFSSISITKWEPKYIKSVLNILCVLIYDVITNDHLLRLKQRYG